MPLVSVIIPTLDRHEMLQQAVASVRAQTFTDLEIIVVDDGSSDGTWQWLAQQPDLRALRNPEPLGPSAARNRGAAEATGRYLALLDSDDLFLPSRVERQVGLMEARPDLPLCHADEIWRRGDKELRQLPKHRKKGGWIFEHCLPMCRISPSAALLRRPVFDELGGFDEELEVAEDYELWLRLTCQYEVGFVPEPLIIKRGGHPGQLSEKYGQIERFRIEGLRRVLARCPLDDGQRAAAAGELRRKCEIFARGCAKRGRTEEAEQYRAMGQRRDQ